jgi:hypothetical protein
MDTYHQLELVPLGEGAWRVCDRSVATSDAASVIAYVEHQPTDDRSELSYEAVWVQFTRGTTRHTSIESVLLMAADLVAASGSTGPSKPKPIAHFPPGGKRPMAPLAG